MAIMERLTQLIRAKRFWAVCGALLLAGSVFLLVREWQRWDNPPAQSLGTEGSITYEGYPIAVQILCPCPSDLTQGRTRALPFVMRLKRQGAAPAPKASTNQYIAVMPNAAAAVIDQKEVFLTDGGQLLSGSEVSVPVSLRITPQEASYSEIGFRFISFTVEGIPPTELGSITWGIPSHAPFLRVATPYFFAVVFFGLLIGLFFFADSHVQQLRMASEKRLAEAKSQADANPDRARFAWDIARVKLEAYFDRNLIQVNMVFWVAVFVMVIGFGFVLAGVVLSLSQSKVTSTSLVAAVSGIITQFIGATFMVIYRSTITQANAFMAVLERINRAGMAVQVLDSLPEGSDLKSSTRAKLAVLLLTLGAPQFAESSEGKLDVTAQPSKS